jgi:hypothetical protein
VEKILTREYQCSVVGPYVPNLVVRDTSSQLDKAVTEYKFSIKPDCVVYSKENDDVTGIDSGVAEFFIEFKYSSGEDPFIDTPPPPTPPQRRPSFIKDSSSARGLIGQIGTYIAVQMDMQYRTHAFFVLIISDFARLMRWDRSGAIFTKPIFYNKDPELLEFFEAYNVATCEERGFDKYVVKPEQEVIDAISSPHQDFSGQASLVVSLPNKDPNAPPNRYVIKSPVARPSFPIGRSTRTSVAYDLQTKKWVFMKDSWRIVADNAPIEGKVYQILNESKVKHIPFCVDFCDVDDDSSDHQTRTGTYSSSDVAWVPSGFQFPFSVLRHHRLVLDTVGKELKDFSSSLELALAIRDALVGMNVSVLFSFARC